MPLPAPPLPPEREWVLPSLFPQNTVMTCCHVWPPHSGDSGGDSEMSFLTDSHSCLPRKQSHHPGPWAPRVGRQPLTCPGTLSLQHSQGNQETFRPVCSTSRWAVSAWGILEALKTETLIFSLHIHSKQRLFSQAPLQRPCLHGTPFPSTCCKPLHTARSPGLFPESRGACRSKS